MNDKIHKDEIEWLVSVYNSSIDEEVTKEAYEKLIEYGLTDKQIQDIFEKTKSDDFPSKAFDKAWAKQAERNEVEKYTLIERIKVFLLGPYELFKHFNSGLKELWDYNYKTKFLQRLILLISGTIFWVLFTIIVFRINVPYENESYLDESTGIVYKFQAIGVLIILLIISILSIVFTTLVPRLFKNKKK